ncbi:hypothetical protein BVX94_01780 [bacterium B17]|nr:hypothetical protein BVX94_01780 [bacterium B17]
MRKLAVLLLILTCSVSFAGEEWIQLFNGKNLDGWTPKFKFHELGENYLDTYRVEDGILKVSYDKYDKFNNKFGHLFYKESFTNYVLRAEYRFVGEQVTGGPGWAFRNNGFMIHGQTPESMSKDQSFPASIEVQLLGGNSDGKGERTTLNLCTPGTHVEYKGKLYKPHGLKSKSKTYHGDQWVTVELEVRGNEVVRHKIDGEVVLEYQKPQLDPSDGSAKPLIEKRNGDVMLHGGTISLQAESHPTEFRKIELKKLK